MIKARIPAENPNANLKSYEQAHKEFSWSSVAASFTNPVSGEANIVRDAIDRWADDTETKDRPALVFDKGSEMKIFFLPPTEGGIKPVGTSPYTAGTPYRGPVLYLSSAMP